MIKDLVSVIIPSSPGDLIYAKRCAESVENSTYKNIHIEIVCEGFERSRQRNIGIERAKGAYLLFLDADQTIYPNLIQDCVNRIKCFGGVYIPEVVMGDDWFAKLRDWERQFYTGTAIDVARFVRAYQCPKFDELQHGPEDSDFDRRIMGGKTISQSCVFHYENVSLFKYLQKKSYYARNMRRFAMRNRGDKILDWRWRCFGVFFENGKWRRFLAKPHYALAVWALIFVRGIIYLCAKKS